MILEYEDDDLETIAKYFQHKAEEYEVYEAARFLCYHNRQHEILNLITEHYQHYQEKIDTLMYIEEDVYKFELAKDLWLKFKEEISCVREVLKYLDIKTPLQKYITDILLKIIKPKVEDCLQQVTLQEIRQYRKDMMFQNQTKIPPVQLFDLLAMLPGYSHFEKSYISQTNAYYQDYILDTDPTQNVIIASKIQSTELILAQSLSKELQQSVNELLKQLIFNQVNLLDLDELYFNTITMKNYVDFATEINALPKLLSGLRKYIYKEVIRILQQTPDQSIHNLIYLEKRSLQLFSSLFIENTNQTIITHAIEDAVNENHEKFSYSLAFALNDHQAFEKFGHLLKYLTDKDSFQNYYVKFLMQRMIKENHQYEDIILNQLQQYCNTEWVNACLEFVQNQRDSLNTTNQFLHKIKSRKHQIQFHFNLIPQSIWPYPLINLILPNPLDQYAESFIKYQSEDQMYQKKKIIFQAKHSKLLLFVKIDHQFELELPLSQALELLHFNQHKQVNQVTNYKQYNGLITRENNNTFKINYQFKPINQIMVLNEEIQVEMEKNAQAISDYLYVVDAAIVKIIKLNKHMLYDNLIQATVDLIKKEYPRFIDLCENEIIDKQIDSLLEKEIIRQRYDVYELI